MKIDLPIGEVKGEGGLLAGDALIIGGGGKGGAGNGGVSELLGKGGNAGGSPGGDGIPESSGVSGEPFGGEISPNSPSLTGDISCGTTSSSTTSCSMTTSVAFKPGGVPGGVLGLGVLGGRTTGPSVPGGGGVVCSRFGVMGEMSPFGISISSDFLSGVNGDMSPFNPGPGEDASVSWPLNIF